MRDRLLASIFTSMTLFAVAGADAANLQSVLEKSRASKQAFIETYRRTGQLERGGLSATTAMLQEAIADPGAAQMLPELRFELGSVLRLAGQFEDAIPVLKQAAAEAEAIGRQGVAFEAWRGAALAYLVGVHDHGAADAAFERATLAAGDAPSDRQRFQLALLRTQLLEERQDLAAGFTAATEAARAAQTAEDWLATHRETASLFQSVAETCDYVPDFDDCRRAVDGARRSYLAAAGVAREVGWMDQATQAEQAAGQLNQRLALIDQQESSDRAWRDQPDLFAPHSVTDVLVSGNFGTDPPQLATALGLAEMADAALRERDASGLGRLDARSLFVSGLVADLNHDPESATRFYVAALQSLEQERGSLLDLRRRGTIIENRIEFYTRAALRLLDLGQPGQAFEIFERARARGLSELVAITERSHLEGVEWSFLSRLLLLEAQANRRQTELMERAVQAAGVDTGDPALDELLRIERERQVLLYKEPDAIGRLGGRPGWSPISLEALQARANAARTSILLYWTGPVNTVVWYIGPGESSVHSVLLPAGVLRDKVRRLRNSVETKFARFDAEASRELYLFLIAPVKSSLAGDRVIIVPQGELLNLPFETLIDPASGRYMVEDFEISYAPNASLAANALDAPRVRLAQTAVIVDEKIATSELDNLRLALGDDHVREVSTYQLTKSALKRAATGADAMHFLVHGEFQSEPLLSTLKFNLADLPGRPFFATDLLDLPITNATLAVLSACESGAVTGTIANEIYGIPWALMVAGVPGVVVSRWRVDIAATASWMGRFYAALARGEPAQQAAAAATRAQLAEAAAAHPYFWAAYQVIGR